MNIHNHEQTKTIKQKGNKNPTVSFASSIEDMADNAIGEFITECEQEYSKSAMSNGRIPCAAIIKAAVRSYLNEYSMNRINDSEISKEEYKKAAADAIEDGIKEEKILERQNQIK